ncbi:SprT domain-containing protein Spartan [Fasciola hepatica]|uniref:SprT domain-containing protein Spartan n=1 Tax=Fasciola hepatica TaxID=6192 RepID=A0A4E0R7C7_FASHE|nr:SprT domain-containing protein Spartan [Fasciola hepatica]
MNRAPGPNDTWWSQHQALCQGTFIKIKEPEKLCSSNRGTAGGGSNKATTSGKSSSFSAAGKNKRTCENSNEKNSSDIRLFLKHSPPDVPSASCDNRQSVASGGRLSQLNNDSVSTQSTYQWPGSGHLLGGVREPKLSRLIMPNSCETNGAKRTTTKSPTDTHVPASVQSSPDSRCDPEPISCPVCTFLIPISQINEHLDVCLT